VLIEFAGAFLTPVGGYPSDRAWAPAGSFREIASEADAAAAVTEMADAGASRIKVASNSTAGPVFDDDMFRTIVELAAARGLPIVAHAEGAGEAQRAVRLGAAALAHAPFTERLSDDEIREQAASVVWTSTLSIHDATARATAVDNVRRFHAAGGTVRYGTDMGNGPTPVDLNPHEIDALREAGVEGADLLRILDPVDPSHPASVRLLLPAGEPDPLHAQILKV
jgi:imidazolonepropionase-like amidohydrolase